MKKTLLMWFVFFLGVSLAIAQAISRGVGDDGNAHALHTDNSGNQYHDNLVDCSAHPATTTPTWCPAGPSTGSSSGGGAVSFLNPQPVTLFGSPTPTPTPVDTPITSAFAVNGAASVTYQAAIGSDSLALQYLWGTYISASVPATFVFLDTGAATPVTYFWAETSSITGLNTQPPLPNFQGKTGTSLIFKNLSAGATFWLNYQVTGN